jgi:Fic family protein
MDDVCKTAKIKWAIAENYCFLTFRTESKPILASNKLQSALYETAHAPSQKQTFWLFSVQKPLNFRVVESSKSVMQEI